MPRLFWDASALVKRYLPEPGSATVDALFDAAPPASQATSPVSYVECYSILLRRHSAGGIGYSDFTFAVSALDVDVLGNPDFEVISITDADLFASTLLIRRHNLNATDGAILTRLLDYAHSLAQSNIAVALIATDRRLLGAAEAEGLSIFNPEEELPAAAAVFIASRT